jgi:hypothetical protein
MRAGQVAEFAHIELQNLRRGPKTSERTGAPEPTSGASGALPLQAESPRRRRRFGAVLRIEHFAKRSIVGMNFAGRFATGLEALNEPDDAADEAEELNGFFRRYALAA